MRRVLGGLAGFREEAKEAPGIRGGFDLGETDVSGNHGQNIVQVMGDAARQSAERFQFARRQALRFGSFSFPDVPEKNRDAAVAWIGVHFVPTLPVGSLASNSTGICSAIDLVIIGFIDRADELREFFPKPLPSNSSRVRPATPPLRRLGG